jgi:uroporphyrin-III C-methyltransferase/precorrin-2 dehydrogenase/sirohydrochlorin ferrochelatase
MGAAMKTFPMFLRMTGRRLIVVGGGEQAAQKVRLAQKTEADIIVVAPEPEAEFQGQADHGRIHLQPDADAETFRNTALVFVATGCPGADAAWHGVAKAAGALVNVVDAPDLCDAITPSIVDRDPVVVAIGTEGTAPVLGRQIKTRIEQLLEPNLGRLAELAGALRDDVAQRVPRPKRRAFWRWVFGDAPRQAHAQGNEDAARVMIHETVVARGETGETSASMITLIAGAEGPGDLMTLRAVQRLQEADVIFHAPDTDPGVLELARRDAERVATGGRDTPDWPVSRVLDRVRCASKTASRIVWLVKGGAIGLIDQPDFEIIPTAMIPRSQQLRLTG